MKTTLIHYPADNRMILVSDEDEFILADNYDANTPEIDLSQEVSDFLGIVDVEKLMKTANGYDMWCVGKEDSANCFIFRDGYKAAFEKAQELNKKMFTEEYMKEAIIYGEARGVSLHYGEKVESYEDYISSLQSPKEYEVEVEMQEVEDYVGFAGHTSYPTFSHIPKITNNKIKVLTIKHHSLTPNKKNNEKKNSYHKHTN